MDANYNFELTNFWILHCGKMGLTEDRLVVNNKTIIDH